MRFLLLLALTSASTFITECQAISKPPSPWDKDTWLLATHADMHTQDPCESPFMYLPVAYCEKFIRAPLQEHAATLTIDQGHMLVTLHVSYSSEFTDRSKSTLPVVVWPSELRVAQSPLSSNEISTVETESAFCATHSLSKGICEQLINKMKNDNIEIDTVHSAREARFETLVEQARLAMTVSSATVEQNAVLVEIRSHAEQLVARGDPHSGGIATEAAEVLGMMRTYAGGNVHVANVFEEMDGSRSTLEGAKLLAAAGVGMGKDVEQLCLLVSSSNNKNTSDEIAILSRFTAKTALQAQIRRVLGLSNTHLLSGRNWLNVGEFADAEKQLQTAYMYGECLGLIVADLNVTQPDGSFTVILDLEVKEVARASRSLRKRILQDLIENAVNANDMEGAQEYMKNRMCELSLSQSSMQGNEEITHESDVGSISLLASTKAIQLLRQEIVPSLFGASVMPFCYSSSEQVIEHLARTDKIMTELLGKLPAIQAAWRVITSSHGREVEIIDPLPFGSFYGVYAGVKAVEGMNASLKRREDLVQVLTTLVPSLAYTAPELFKRVSLNNREMKDGKPRRIHLAIASAYLYDHSVGKLLCPGIYQLVSRFPELVRVSMVQISDVEMAHTRAAPCAPLRALLESRKGVDSVYDIPISKRPTTTELSRTRNILKAIRADVLVYGEVGLTPVTYLLGMSRLAPVQIAFWGHPLSTGMRETMDYMISPKAFLRNEDVERVQLPHTTWSNLLAQPSEEEAAPVDDEQIGPLPVCLGRLNNMIPFVETLLCTDTLLAYFEPLEPLDNHPAMESARRVLHHQLQKVYLESNPDYSSSPLSLQQVTELRASHHLYYLPHKMMKFHPDMDTSLASILLRDPKALFVIPRGDVVDRGFSVFAQAQGIMHKRISRAVHRLLGNGTGDFDVDADLSRGRIVWIPAVPNREFAALAVLCDVVLDAAPIAAGVTALEILSQGIPLVSLPNSIILGPSVCGMYKLMGVSTDELCARDGAHYVELAVKLASNPELRQNISKQLLVPTAFSKLFESDAVTNEWAAIVKGTHEVAKWEWVDGDKNVVIEREALLQMYVAVPLNPAEAIVSRVHSLEPQGFRAMNKYMLPVPEFEVPPDVMFG